MIFAKVLSPILTLYKKNQNSKFPNREMACQSHTPLLWAVHTDDYVMAAVFKTHPPKGPARLASQSSFYENTRTILTNMKGFESRNFSPKCQRHKHLPAPRMPVPECVDGSDGEPRAPRVRLSVQGCGPLPHGHLRKIYSVTPSPALCLLVCASPHTWTWNPERPLSSVLPPCANSRAATSETGYFYVVCKRLWYFFLVKSTRKKQVF